MAQFRQVNCFDLLDLASRVAAQKLTATSQVEYNSGGILPPMPPTDIPFNGGDLPDEPNYSRGGGVAMSRILVKGPGFIDRNFWTILIILLIIIGLLLWFWYRLEKKVNNDEKWEALKNSASTYSSYNL